MISIKKLCASKYQNRAIQKSASLKTYLKIGDILDARKIGGGTNAGVKGKQSIAHGTTERCCRVCCRIVTVWYDCRIVTSIFFYVENQICWTTLILKGFELA